LAVLWHFFRATAVINSTTADDSKHIKNTTVTTANGGAVPQVCYCC